MTHLLSQKDYVLFTQLCKLTESAAYSTMTNFLEKSGFKSIEKSNNYIMAIGNIPIALVAHMDTVFPHPIFDMYYDKEKNVMWSPDGAGFDDRAGMFAIIKLIQKGFRPTVIFTLGEEMGGIGAAELVKFHPKAPVELKYIIELDRQGENDCVFYRCKNDTFTNYIKSYGFHVETGTFTDISIICPAWGIAGVNLSIGYECEHSYSEFLHVDWMKRTMDIVAKMLTAYEVAPFFEYVGGEDLSWLMAPQEECLCAHCRKPFSDFDLFDVVVKKGKKQLCIDCVTELANWCERCGEPFVIDRNNPEAKYCYRCQEVEKNGK